MSKTKKDEEAIRNEMKNLIKRIYDLLGDLDNLTPSEHFILERAKYIKDKYFKDEKL